ncbi:MAG: sigma-70 family RNA polymerase sigma factor [Planctomycetota bacterium]|jgi:RNA polymerase sigma factor (sigma-70 family)
MDAGWSFFLHHLVAALPIEEVALRGWQGRFCVPRAMRYNGQRGQRPFAVPANPRFAAMTFETTSPSLLSRVRDPADAAAWREFDARYGELILRYCRGRGLQHGDAEDLRQVVMVKLSKALPQFQYSPARGRFRSFLGQIVRNEVARYFSRPKAAGRGVDTSEAVVQEATDAEQAEGQWGREWIHHHLRLAMQRVRQSHEPRSVEIFERLLAGDTVKAVATAFGVSTDAVHKIKQRIRDRLKEYVAAQIREEDDPDG